MARTLGTFAPASWLQRLQLKYRKVELSPGKGCKNSNVQSRSCKDFSLSLLPKFRRTSYEPPNSLILFGCCLLSAKKNCRQGSSTILSTEFPEVPLEVALSTGHHRPVPLRRRLRRHRGARRGTSRGTGRGRGRAQRRGGHGHGGGGVGDGLGAGGREFSVGGSARLDLLLCLEASRQPIISILHVLHVWNMYMYLPTFTIKMTQM